MRTPHLLLALLVLLIGPSCAPPEAEDLLTTRRDVEAVLDAWIQGLEALDASALSSLFDLDSEVASWGVGAAERYVGRESYETHVRQFAEMAESNGVEVREQQLAISAGQSVAWFNQVRDYRGTSNDGQELRLEGVRVTGVLERRNGKWVVVHFHHSVPLQMPAPDSDTGQ